MDQIEAKRTSLQNTTSELINLKKENDMLYLSQGSFVGNDNKTKVYTGLPKYALLATLYTLVGTCLTQGGSVAPF